MSELKSHLGEGIYIDFVDGKFILTTEFDKFITNTVVLYPDHIDELFRYTFKVDRREMYK